jgi:glycosyltransferase involved in cell wall biosynthesis
MNVMLVAEGRYPDFTGGSATFMHHISRELLARGHEVHSLTRNAHRELPDYQLDQGVHVHRYPGPPVRSRFHWLYPAISFWGARRSFVSLNHQVHVDAIMFNHPFPALGILSLAQSSHIRKLYIFHSASHLEFRAAVPRDGIAWDSALRLPMAGVRLAEGRAMRGSDAIICLSSYTKDGAIRFHGEAAERITVIPGGVDTKLYSPIRSREERKHLREELDVSPEAFVLFAAKRLYRGMGLEKLADAVGLLADKRVYLLLAGDGPWRANLERIICRKGLEDRVRLLGNVPHDQMPSYYQVADLFVSTRAEPFGLVILEALACGLPVLSVPLGGAIEILEGLSYDSVFEDTSSTAMAHLILKYLYSSGELIALSSECRRYVEDKYTWAIAGTRVERLLC